MFSVINSFQVRFHRHRIPLTLISPLAISLLLELTGEKKKLIFFKWGCPFQALFLSPMQDFLKSAKYFKSGCYEASVRKKKKKAGS